MRTGGGRIMGVTTVGIIGSEVTEQKVLEAVRVYFDPKAVIEEVLEDKLYSISFSDGNDNRNLSVHVNHSDLSNYRNFLSPIIKEVTLIDVGYWGRSTMIIKRLVEEFGGHMTNSDHEENWIAIEMNKNQYEESIHQYEWKQETMEEIRKDISRIFKENMPEEFIMTDLAFCEKNNVVAVCYRHSGLDSYGVDIVELPTYKGNPIVIDQISEEWDLTDPIHSTVLGKGGYKNIQKNMVNDGYFFVKATESLVPYTAI
jgi:hypothetical protein